MVEPMTNEANNKKYHFNNLKVKPDFVLTRERLQLLVSQKNCTGLYPTGLIAAFPTDNDIAEMKTISN